MKRDAAALLAVLAAAGAAGASLFVQVTHPFPFLNDAVLHFGLVETLESAPARGQSLLDPWVPMWTLGFPVFHYYQILPHLAVLAVAKASAGALSTLVAFRLVEALAAVVLPSPVYFGARHLGFSRVAAAAAGVLSLAPRTNYLHGMELESSTWQGLGQFTQAFGMTILPLALSRSWSAIAGRSSIGVAAALTAAAALAHVALGAMALFAAALFVPLSPREIPRRLARLALLAVLIAAGASFTLVPIARDFAYYNVSALVPSWKYDSFGHETILPWLATGALFDYGRAPILTALVAFGLLVALRRSPRDESARAVSAAFAGFLLLYFGRPTWGPLLEALPFGDGFHFSRALAPLQLSGVLLAGIGAGALLERVARTPRLGRTATAAAAVAAVALAAPLVLDRARYLARNADLVRESAAGYEREKDDLECAIALAAGDRLGRVYAGLGAAGGPAWGGAFMVGWVPVYSFLPCREVDAFGYLHHQYSLNSDLFDRFDERNPVHYDVFGIRRILAPAEGAIPPFTEEIGRFGRFRVLEVSNGEGDGAGGVAVLRLADAPFAVHVSRRELGRVQSRWLASTMPRAHLHPLVHLAEAAPPSPNDVRIDGGDVRFPDIPEPTADAPARGRILGVERRGEDFWVSVEIARDCLLVLEMTYHPLWKAVVDGRPVETAHVLPSYVGVPLTAGAHRIELRYAGDPSKPVLCAAGLTTLAAGVFFTRRRRAP